MKDVSVAVFGSINMDLVVRVERHPAPGETILGHDHFRSPGGKGANQAVAAARLGQRVAMIGRVGRDAEGDALVENLESCGVVTEHVVRDRERPSGVAFIQVDDAGENSIVVSPGANSAVSAEDAEEAAGVLEKAGVTLLQLEVPLPAVAAAARRAGGIVILNVAPARALPQDLLATADIVVANAGELALLAGGGRSEDPASIERHAGSLGRTTIVTLGADGALLVDEGRSVHVPGFAVDVVDTTGAGDSFCGALADALARNRSLEDAVRWANAAAALAVTTAGAQTASPGADAVRARLEE